MRYFAIAHYNTSPGKLTLKRMTGGQGGIGDTHRLSLTGVPKGCDRDFAKTQHSITSLSATPALLFRVFYTLNRNSITSPSWTT